MNLEPRAWFSNQPVCWTLPSNCSCKPPWGVYLDFFPSDHEQAFGPLDLIIAVIEEKKMLFTVIMGITLMEACIPSAMPLYS